jgi:hypothetical protein
VPRCYPRCRHDAPVVRLADEPGLPDRQRRRDVNSFKVLSWSLRTVVHSFQGYFVQSERFNSHCNYPMLAQPTARDIHARGVRSEAVTGSDPGPADRSALCICPVAAPKLQNSHPGRWRPICRVRLMTFSIGVAAAKCAAGNSSPVG